mmetsp:Transcript_5489/g.9286  ORF Transcript_5489/g.9286 Transcript_5489/m.9286 type:complete len:201 (-) Transcript_5489:1454-2056(-)
MLCNKLPRATCESSPALSKLPLDSDCNRPPKVACESFFPAFSRLPLLDNDWINVSICAELFDSVSKEARFDDDASSTRFSTDCKSIDMRTLKLPRSADCDNFFPSTFASSEPSPFTISSTNLAAKTLAFATIMMCLENHPLEHQRKITYIQNKLELTGCCPRQLFQRRLSSTNRFSWSCRRKLIQRRTCSLGRFALFDLL